MSTYSSRTNAALAVALRRQYSNPLDVSAVFRCLDDFEAYVVANTSYSNTNYSDSENSELQKLLPYAYDGQIVAVLDEDNSSATAYIIKKAGTLGSGEIVSDRYSEIGASAAIQASILAEAEAYTDSKFAEVPTALIQSITTSQMSVTDGKLAITSISTDILVNGDEELVLSGGTATEGI